MKSIALVISTVIVGFAALAGFGGGTAHSQQVPAPNMSFFVTSTSEGRGGDLGGLEGADVHCQALAQAVGAGSKTWRAYLSTQPTGAASAINARDRIGTGPWYNAKGLEIATNLQDLHSDNYKINKTTALDEKENFISGRGDTPNQHDILTGSMTGPHFLPETTRHVTIGRAVPKVVLSLATQT